MASPIKPITPQEAAEKKLNSIPEEIIEIFNELIVKNYNVDISSSTVKQKEVLPKICSALQLTSHQIFDRKWLDVEELFDRAGWNVKYNKPARDEDFEAYFEFKKK